MSRRRLPTVQDIGCVIYRCSGCGQLAYEEMSEELPPRPLGKPCGEYHCKCWKGPNWRRGTWVAAS